MLMELRMLLSTSELDSIAPSLLLQYKAITKSLSFEILQATTEQQQTGLSVSMLMEPRMLLSTSELDLILMSLL
jgi:hypothetical protein